MTITDPLILQDDKNKYCPVWTNLFGRKVPCIGERCVKYNPPIPEDKENDIPATEGICNDSLLIGCLQEISLSLAVLSGRLILTEAVEQEKQIEEPKGHLYG